MGGAYTAKPEAVASPPDVPEGWDIDWPFPGPSPPGYEPEYSLGVTASASVPVGGAAAGVATLYDHDIYKTPEPEESSLLWTATLEGAPLGLRLAGGGTYASSVTTGYAETEEEFWGSGTTFEFDTTEDDEGKTIVLCSASIVFDDVPVTGVANILISSAIDNAVFTVTLTPGDIPWDDEAPFDAISCYLTVLVSGKTATGLWPDVSGPPFDLDDFLPLAGGKWAWVDVSAGRLGGDPYPPPYYGSSAVSGTADMEVQDDDNPTTLSPSVTVNSFDDTRVYAFFYHHAATVRYGGIATAVWNVKFYSGETLIEEYEKTIEEVPSEPYAVETAWLYFDGRDGTVYEV